jgi:hypothetical protein
MSKPPTEPDRQTAQLMFLANGTKVIVAARSDRDSADRHAVNGDLLAWGDYNELMEEGQEQDEKKC